MPSIIRSATAPHAGDDATLRLASAKGRTETMKVLEAAGADVHAVDDGALRWASWNGHTETVKVLEAAGVLSLAEPAAGAKQQAPAS